MDKPTITEREKFAVMEGAKSIHPDLGDCRVLTAKNGTASFVYREGDEDEIIAALEDSKDE